MTENEPALGPSRGFCPAHGGTEPHHMVSISAGKLVRYVERCSLCGWIDTDALDGWAENAIKLNANENAQNIAVAAGTRPFAFVQRSDEDLTLDEVLGQALGAASMCWESPDKAGTFNPSRAKEIWFRLRAEVLNFQRKEEKSWRDLAYELYALACNSATDGHSTPEVWNATFERLKMQFHGLLSESERDELPGK